MDVARKLVILAREISLALELSEVAVESLVPHDLRDCSTEGFLEGVAGHDARMHNLLEAAGREGKRLRYVGRFTNSGEATVGIEHIDAGHPFGNIAMTDNILRFVTDLVAG